MSDIVEDLMMRRADGTLFNPSGPTAADTITRLTAGVEGLKRQIAEWVDAGGEAHSVIQRQMEDRAKLRAALGRWLDAVNDKRAFEHHHPDDLGKEWSRLREAVDLAEDNARAALSGDKHE